MRISEMAWISGPFNDHAILWLGIQVFWWRRIIYLLQFISGLFILSNLLTEQHKMRLHVWLGEKRSAAQQIRIPEVVRLRDVVKWELLIIAVLSAGLSQFILMSHGIYDCSVFIRLSVPIALLLAIFAFPVAMMVIGTSMSYMVVAAGRKYAPGILAWTFHRERFDHSITIMSVIVLVITSLGQIYLS